MDEMRRLAVAEVWLFCRISDKRSLKDFTVLPRGLYNHEIDSFRSSSAGDD